MRPVRTMSVPELKEHLRALPHEELVTYCASLNMLLAKVALVMPFAEAIIGLEIMSDPEFYDEAMAICKKLHDNKEVFTKVKL